MAKYGYNKYGSGFRYGETTAISVYYNSQITAWSIDYATVQVNWTNVVPNPTDPYPTHWKLVKSFTGTLDDPADGITLTGGIFSEFITSYTDISLSGQGLEANYSIWVFNGTKWVFCGDDYTVVVTNKDTLTKLTSWLPKAWLNNVDGVGEALSGVEQNSFITTLGVFSFMYDKISSEAALLGNINSYTSLPSVIVNNKITDFGFSKEPALGDSYHRSLYAAGNIINEYKGTAIGIGTYVTSLTHFTNSISVGHNLLLDYNDSSFEESIGRWSASAGTLTTQTYAVSGIGSPTTLVLKDRSFQPRVVGHAKYTTTAMTARTLTLPNPALDTLTNAVPVKERTRYVFSGWAMHVNNSATVTAKINWYDRSGNLLGTTPNGSSITTDTSWKEFTSSSDSGRNGKLSPKGAAYAGISITVTPTVSATNNYYFDFFQLAEADKSFEYEDARKIHVNISGNSLNKIPNSSFDDSVAFWYGLNGALSKDITNSSGVAFGTSSAKLVSTSTGTAGYVSDWFAVSPNKVITLSGYLIGSEPRNVKARIEFSNKLTAELQVAVLKDEDGDYFSPDVAYVDSEALTLTPFRQRVHVSTVIPPYTSDSGDPFAKVSFYIEDNQAGDVYWLDNVLVETSLEPNPYVSGSGGVFPTDPVTDLFYREEDCYWATENIFNYVSNPSFEDNTTDWTSTATLASVTSDGSYGPLFGNKFGKLTYSSSGSATFTAYLPTAALGGEDFVASAYVRNAVATYTLEGTSQTVDLGNSTNWVRIVGTKKLTAGQTSVSFTINVTNTSGSTSTVAHIDGVQAEYGRLPSKFVNPSNAAVTVLLDNPLTAGKKIYAAQDENTNATRGNYSYNYELKSLRVSSTLGLVVPSGSSYGIKTVGLVDDYKDIPSSLVPASSFEKNISGWVGNNSTLTRVVALGTLFGDTTTQGQAYAKITTSGTGSFGTTSDKAYVIPNGGHYAAVAVRPTNADAYGQYTLRVDFYDAADNLINVYLDNLTDKYTTSAVDSESNPNTLVTDAVRTKTVSISHSDRWAYIANVFPIGTLLGASYAKVSVTCSPTANVAGQSFDLDRVVFRQ